MGWNNGANRYVCPECGWTCHEDEAEFAVRTSRRCRECDATLAAEPVED